MAVNTHGTRFAKCGKCKGDPRQHNVRDAEIFVPETGKTHSQHGFQFTGTK